MRAIAQRVLRAPGTIGVTLEIPAQVIAEKRFGPLRKAEMNAHANKPLHLPPWAGGISAILVSGLAMGTLAIAAYGYNGIFSFNDPTAATVAPAIAGPGVRASRCAECGVIESTREIETPADETDGNASGHIAAGRGIAGTRVRNSEITIRLQDGSMRVITDANPARWRPGERVIIIAGMD